MKYSVPELLVMRQSVPICDSKRMIPIATYPQSECDARLLEAVEDGAFPPMRLIQRCSSKAQIEALRLSLRLGLLHIVDLLQPNSSVFRGNHTVTVPADVLTSWIGDCIDHPESIRWLLDHGADISAQLRAENVRAIRVLTELARSSPILLSLLSSPRKNLHVRKAVLENFLVARERTEAVRQAVAAVVGDATAEYALRWRAAEVLGKLTSDASIILNGPYLDHPDQSVRATAICCLGMIGDEKAIPVLIEYLDSQLRLCAIEALGKCGRRGGPGVDDIARFCASADPETREAACYALGRRGKLEHAQAVAELFDDQIAEVRYAAEFAFSEMVC